ncbi:MAG: MBL fold metallo-hydrolase [Alphaproteobacteria bacterium]|nr:MBL fold metallo-hydrolase [Alphaproteobacteria bacterium]
MNRDRILKSAQYDGEKFVNAAPMPQQGLSFFPKMIRQQMFEKMQPSAPKLPIPVQTITPEQLANLPANETIFFKLGHSSLLLWIENEFWLIDPLFSDRASPFSFFGPKRFHPTPLSIADLPDIKGVILSHNHYDHLDKASIEALNAKVENFYMPLGVGASLAQWGVSADQIHEYDWHESVNVGALTLTATPSQHFSGRGLSDRNQSLWASWVIKSSQHNIYFSGDSGYFSGFKDIGTQYGPFDISFMETGAYNTLWPDVHMMPQETVQAFIDLKGSVLVPIHNSTFDLSVHAWFDPLEQVLKYSDEQNVKLLVPEMGDPINLNAIPELKTWWQELM